MRCRHALAADLPALTPVLSRSFLDDPLMAFLCPDRATRYDDLQVLFTVAASAGLRRGHAYVVTDAAGDIAGAAIWSPPEVEALSDDDVGPLLDAIVDRYGDEGLMRMGAVSEAMDANHPDSPHLYLFVVGIDPSQQGNGLGERLLAPTLAYGDATGAAAYLESTNPRNIGFYQRLGFEIVSEFHPEGGPLLTGMWREPVG